MKKLHFILILAVLGLSARTGFAQEAVDLGLSVKWATCNVGASSPYDVGSYFAWGEVEAKESYWWRNYSMSNTPDYSDMDEILLDKQDPSVLTEYCGSDGKTRLDSADDVACQKWGENWRIPTADEWKELLENCDWAWTNGASREADFKVIINGFRVTSKKNGNSIFLPASGICMGVGTAESTKTGYYWSSSLNTDNPVEAWCFSFFPGGSLGWHTGLPRSIETETLFRSHGLPVRPVTD